MRMCWSAHVYADKARTIIWFNHYYCCCRGYHHDPCYPHARACSCALGYHRQATEIEPLASLPTDAPRSLDLCSLFHLTGLENFFEMPENSRLSKAFYLGWGYKSKGIYFLSKSRPKCTHVESNYLTVYLLACCALLANEPQVKFPVAHVPHLRCILCLCHRELQRIKLEIYANPDLELDDRVKKLRQVNYKNDYRQRCHSDKVSIATLPLSGAKHIH